MEFCVLAKIVLVLAILTAVFHVCIFGLSIRLLVDLLFMALLVFITNRYCDSWIAKGIVIFAIIGTLTYFFMCSTKPNMSKKSIEDEKTNHKKRRIDDEPNQWMRLYHYVKCVLLLQYIFCVITIYFY